MLLTPLMALPVYARPRELPELLEYFLEIVLPEDLIKSKPKQLELLIQQDELSLRLSVEGEWHNPIPSWYSAETRRQVGFTPAYLEQISAEVETAAAWKTKEGLPVVACQHSELFAPRLYFFEAVREPERLLFTLIGYCVTKEEFLRPEPLELLNGGTIYPR